MMIVSLCFGGGGGGGGSGRRNRWKKKRAGVVFFRGEGNRETTAKIQVGIGEGKAERK